MHKFTTQAKMIELSNEISQAITSWASKTDVFSIQGVYETPEQFKKAFINDFSLDLKDYPAMKGHIADVIWDLSYSGLQTLIGASLAKSAKQQAPIVSVK